MIVRAELMPFQNSASEDASGSPVVSVVLPTYNRAAWVRGAIASVLAQGCRNLELLVIDDASADHTEQTVRAFSDPRLKYFRNHCNMGLSASRNRGVRASRGPWIAFLDDDDEWLPEKLRKQLPLTRTVAPAVGVLYTGFRSIDREGGMVIGETVATARGDLSQALRAGNLIQPSTAIVRRECFETVGLFDENLRYGEDYDLWIRIAQRFQFECISEPLVRRGRNTGGMTQNWRYWADGMQPIIAKHSGYFTPQLLSGYLLLMGIGACMGGDMDRGRRAFLRSIRANPFQKRAPAHLVLSFFGTDMYSRARIRHEESRERRARAKRRLVDDPFSSIPTKDT